MTTEARIKKDAIVHVQEHFLFGIVLEETLNLQQHVIQFVEMGNELDMKIAMTETLLMTEDVILIALEKFLDLIVEA